MSKVVIIGGARTPIGKLSGSLASFSGTQLGSVAISAALADAGVPPEEVDYVFMGQVLLAGEGQAPARAAAARAGIPMSVPASTVNKVCLSGLNAVYLAERMIAAGDAAVVVAGGMESMTSAPYLATGVRSGLKLGDSALSDSMMSDGLTCAIDHCSMGLSTERYSAKENLSREAQDAFAAASHERAARAHKDGLMETEIVPVEIPQRRGDSILFSSDEGVRPETSVDSLSVLRPAFDASGSITAGNASQISDGASALVIASTEAAERLSADPMAEIMSYAQVAGPDASLLHQPAAAITKLLERNNGLSLSEIDLFEINEAFAAVVLASMNDLGIPHDVVNVNGGAIALGHPIGASGNRVLLTLIKELQRQGGGIGAAALCGGGGQGDAALIRV